MQNYLLGVISRVPNYYRTKVWRLATAMGPTGQFSNMTVAEFRRRAKNRTVLLGPYNPFREVSRVGKKTWEKLVPILVADGILPQPPTRRKSTQWVKRKN